MEAEILANPMILQKYKQYKRDTSSIVNWLISIARQCGFTSSSGLQDPFQSSYPNQNSNIIQPKGRLKGKERKKAREAENLDKNQTPRLLNIALKTPYKITIEEFKEMVDYLANCQSPQSKIPENFFCLINDAIKARKEHMSIFAKLCYQRDSKQMYNHEYFINVLEYTHDILLPKKQLSTPTKSPTKPPAAPSNCSNQFKILKVEEPLNFPSRQPSISDLNEIRASKVKAKVQVDSKPRQALKANVKQIFESCSGEEYLVDLGFDRIEQGCVLFSFMIEISKIRGYVRSLWRDYKDEKMTNPIPAAVATNTAIHFVRNLEDTLRYGFPGINEYRSVVCDLYTTAATLDNAWNLQAEETRFEALRNLNESGAEWCMLPTFNVVNSFCEQWLNPTDECPLTHDQKLSIAQSVAPEKTAVLQDWLQVLFNIGASSSELDIADEISSATKVIGTTKIIPIWTIFALQLFADTKMDLKESFEKPFDYLDSYTHIVNATIDSTNKWHEQVNAFGPKSNIRCQNWMRECIRRFTKNVCPNRKAILEKLTTPPDDMETFFTQNISCYPLRAGLTAFILKAFMQEFGVGYANLSGSVMYTCHLYNAVRNECQVQMWDDIELFIAHNVKDGLFVGDPPTSRYQSMKQLDLIMGMAACNFAQNRQKMKANQSRDVQWKAPKYMSAYSSMPVTEIFVRAFRDDDPPLPDRAKDLYERIVKVLEARSIRQNGEIYTSRVKKTLEETSQILPLAVLSVVYEAMCAELIPSNIDYMSLHRSCWRLLHQISDECQLPKAGPYGIGPPPEQEPVFITRCILDDAFMHQPTVECVCKCCPCKFHVSGGTGFKPIADCLDTWLSKGNGGHLLRQMKFFGLDIKLGNPTVSKKGKIGFKPVESINGGKLVLPRGLFGTEESL
ncbi:hypothetical protein AA313_de0203244 [Arthrobotrys entomopaga]|nr:hypothetical protein AA313_de0203244 [Arthrobotrys entomopaga]